jgi:para-nitrobenzyl esterase
MNWKSLLRFKIIGVVLAVALIMIPVSYVPATEKDFDWRGGHYDKLIADPIKTDAGYVSGTMIDVVQRCWINAADAATCIPSCSQTLLGEVGKPVRVYRGIPYAAPPVGNLRWKPPQPVTPWKGIRECTEFTPMAAQPFSPPNFFWGCIPESGMSEDVLYLNVATPAKHDHEHLPVMVWFHGGGITSGTNSPDGVGNYMGAAGGYLTGPLPNHGIVLVTVQHRIGPLGYMAHPALSAESPNHVSGNYGQLDLIAALQWVQRNIAAFGGDPGNVTIFGQSGGGQKVLWLMASPLAKGLFHKVICQSGGIGGTPLATTEQYGLNLAAKLGINGSGPDALAALRAKPWQDIITAANTPGSGYSSLFTVDGWSMMDTGPNIFASGRQNDVPLIISYTGQEVSPVKSPTTFGLIPAIRQNSKVYVYLFTHVPTGWQDDGVFAWHGVDVALEFGDLTALNAFVGVPLPGGGVPASTPLNPVLTKKDYWVSEYMMDMVTRFAETGNPNIRGLPQWPAYDPHTDQYMDIGFPLLVKSGFSTLTTQQPPR